MEGGHAAIRMIDVRILGALLLSSLVGCIDSERTEDRSPSSSQETRDAPVIIEATPADVQAAFEGRGKLVLTLAGYSGAGYEDEEAMLARVRDVLEEYDPESTLVNLGATVDGIGAAYEMASTMGFETTGVVSSQARESNATFSPFVDRIYVVTDEEWGGIVEETGELSPTSEAMVGVSDVIIGIGGGEVARDEMSAARDRGIEVRFFPADLNHQRALERADGRGEPAPTDFRGAAHLVFGGGEGDASDD